MNCSVKKAISIALLNVSIDQNLLDDASILDDPIIAAVRNYKRHRSILKNMAFFLFIMLTPIKC